MSSRPCVISGSVMSLRSLSSFRLPTPIIFRDGDILPPILLVAPHVSEILLTKAAK